MKRKKEREIEERLVQYLKSEFNLEIKKKALMSLCNY